MVRISRRKNSILENFPVKKFNFLPEYFWNFEPLGLSEQKNAREIIEGVWVLFYRTYSLKIRKESH